MKTSSKIAISKTIKKLLDIFEDNEAALEDAFIDQEIDGDTASMVLSALNEELSNNVESIYEEGLAVIENSYSVISTSYNNYYSTYVPCNFSHNIWSTEPFVTQVQTMFTGELGSK